MKTDVGMIYVIELDRPLGNPDNRRGTASTYVGWTTDLFARLREHRKGIGSRILAAAAEQGIGWRVSYVTPGTPALESAIKARKNTRRWLSSYLKSKAIGDAADAIDNCRMIGCATSVFVGGRKGERAYFWRVITKSGRELLAQADYSVMSAAELGYDVAWKHDPGWHVLDVSIPVTVRPGTEKLTPSISIDRYVISSMRRRVSISADQLRPFDVVCVDGEQWQVIRTLTIQSDAGVTRLVLSRFTGDIHQPGEQVERALPLLVPFEVERVNYRETQSGRGWSRK